VNVLEVAMGEAHVSREVFLPRFEEVDMFDRDSHAVNMALALQKKHPRIKRVELSTMQAYQFQTKYSLVFMRYVSGYMSDGEYKAFLRKAKVALKATRTELGGKCRGCAYIIIMDNIAEADMIPGEKDGQTVRTQPEYERLFRQAGLKIKAQSELITVPKNLCDLKIWGLA